MDTQDRTEAVHIHEDADGARQFVLHPSDHDILVQNGQQVIKACRLGISVEVWIEECKSMIQMVAEWANRHNQQVSECHAVLRPSGIAFFIVPKKDSFDFDLAAEIVDLDREVEGFNVGQVELYQVPAAELRRFAAPADCIQVYSNADSAHSPVEA